VNQLRKTPQRQIARAAGIVMVGMALSSLTGLLSTMLISRAFGTSADLEAYVAANRVTEIIFNLISGGALASAFLPVFTGFLENDDRQGAWELASSIINLAVLLLTGVGILTWISAPWLVPNVIAPGFSDASQIELTVSLLRLMLVTPILFGVSGLVMAILQAHQHFALPALAPASYRLGTILGVLLLAPSMGIYGLAWGVVLGTALHLLVQVPALPSRKPAYTPTLGLKNPAVRQVALLMGPRLLGVAVVQLNFLVNTILASNMAEGSLSSLMYAFALMIMPLAIIGQAIAVAALPTFSAQVARGEMREMQTALGTTLRAVVFLALPASLGLVVFRVPIIQMLLERQAFGSNSTSMVAWALLWYGAGLLGHSILEIIVRAFYAMQDTRTPVLVGATFMGLNVLLSLILSSLFQTWGLMPHGGLALANSIATAFESGILLWLLRRRLGGLGLKGSGRAWAVMALGGTAMTLTLWAWMRGLAEVSPIVIGAGGIVLGALVYFLITAVFRLEEVGIIFTLFNRIRRRPFS
jgi:putative peptidoglycan lipid II flippase